MKSKRSRGPKQIAQVEFLKEVLDSPRNYIGCWVVAIDGGANLGDWTAILAERFQHVLAFEPAQENYDGLMQRFAGTSNVEVIQQALHKNHESMLLQLPPGRRACTAYFAVPDAHGETQGVTIDSFDLPFCDLIKLDLEGNEYNALCGAKRTIKRCKPVIIVELTLRSKRFNSSPRLIRSWLEARGYKEVMFRDVDAVYVPCSRL